MYEIVHIKYFNTELIGTLTTRIIGAENVVGLTIAITRSHVPYRPRNKGTSHDLER